MSLRTLLPRLAVVMFGVFMAFVLIEVYLHITVLDRVVYRPRNVAPKTYQYRVKDGDLLALYPEGVRAPDDGDRVLSEPTLSFDADGFRVPLWTAEHYDYVIIGDSYAEAASVPRTFVDVIAEQIDQPVRNMGYHSYGPLQYLRVYKDFAAPSHPKVIVLAYFEGNDLADAVTIRHLGESLLLPRIITDALGPSRSKASTPDYKFPVNVNLSTGPHPMAYFPSYLSWLNGEQADYEQSENIQLLRETLSEMRGETCLVLAYLPTAPHIYAPYVAQEDRARFLSIIQRLRLDRPGAALRLAPEDGSFESVLTRLDNQRHVVLALAQELGIPSIDLTPAFQAGAARGEVLWYDYDTHWNQAGHDLAGKIIADALLHQSLCVSS